MEIIVVQELREEMSEDVDPGDPIARIEAVHAMPVDPGDRTLCGMPAADMERLSDQPDGPDVPWVPPGKEDLRCSGCADALRDG
ncbi:hypothetical protein PV371_33255 [Streptomyces sp. TX20-6-3]|uniref:hypothetical protein n=1 Tax=Streptomyces sp. TX20-6-3 TaxID=3028705 RepID=UPI0029BED07A|nr:hypothetical protein [Streptomyces sp. TX20-6-3]MDX2564494.1 hypothetical protein [Streptomyces sp. TX20-6-3]